MEPTVMVGKSLTMDLGAYKASTPKRADIVVLSPPPADNADPSGTDLVKRVIGLSGETISSTGGQVLINGTPLNEPWLLKGILTTGITTQVIPANEYFVMGDNRSDSQDSRFFGPITASEIVGKVMLSGCNG